jgi:hypothetical protein
MDDLIFVNAYEVSRHYGGPEEGGWWYNAFSPLASVPVRGKAAAKKVQARLRRMFADVEHGDINSVLGGAELGVYLEDEMADYSPKERPYYE